MSWEECVDRDVSSEMLLMSKVYRGDTEPCKLWHLFTLYVYFVCHWRTQRVNSRSFFPISFFFTPHLSLVVSYIHTSDAVWSSLIKPIFLHSLPTFIAIVFQKKKKKKKELLLCVDNKDGNKNKNNQRDKK